MAITNSHKPGRRHDLDWLRIIAFALLIFYHIGMFYVSWGWHIKSLHAGPQIEPLMRLVNPWRLLLLFFISGVASKYLLDKLGSQLFTLERVRRLSVPLLFGMLVIVVPQAYFELLGKGEIEAGYLAFYPRYLDINSGFSSITPTWNHLWYIVYLLVYCLILVGIAPALKFIAQGPLGQWAAQLPAMVQVLVLPVVPLLLVRFTLADQWPTTHNLTSDWANHASSFLVFLIGYWAAKSPSFWMAVDKTRWISMALTIGLIIPLTGLWMNWAWVDQVSQTGIAGKVFLITIQAGRIIYAWVAIASLLGFAQRKLNQPGPNLRYLTSVIFPYYILHQTLIIALGFPLAKLDLPLPLEAGLLIAGTIGGCVLLSEFVIRRIGFLRPLFGMK